MELKGVRGALTRADQMEHGMRPASPHGVRPASSPPPNFTLAAAITSLQRQQVQQEHHQHYHMPSHLSLRSAGIASADVANATSGSNVEMSLSRNALEVEGREEVQQCLIEMLQGRHPLQLQVRTTEA